MKYIKYSLEITIPQYHHHFMTKRFYQILGQNGGPIYGTFLHNKIYFPSIQMPLSMDTWEENCHYSRNITAHPDGRISNSDWVVNICFIIIVCDNFFGSFFSGHQILTESKNKSHRGHVSGITHRVNVFDSSCEILFSFIVRQDVQITSTLSHFILGS